MALSSNGDRYATVYGDDGRYLEIWDSQTGEGNDPDVMAEPGLAWSPDGKAIVARDYANVHVKIWDSSTGMILQEYNVSFGDYRPWAVDWSPDGSMIAGVNGEVYMLKYPDGSQWYPLQNCGDQNVTLIWSPDNAKLAALSTDGNIRICDPKTDQLLYQLRGIPQQAELPDLAWSPDGRLLAVSAYRYRYINSRMEPTENAVTVWETTSWQPIRTFRGPVQFSSVAFSPDSKTLAIGCWDGTIWLIEP